MSKDPKKKSTMSRIPGNLDYVLDVLRYAESSDTSGIRARGKNDKGDNVYASSGYGYYQVIKGTLDDINKSAVADGLKPLTLNSREEQHEAGRRLVLDYDRYLRNTLGIEKPTLEDYYGVHFKGKEGYRKLLSADKSEGIGKYATKDEISANGGVLKGTVGDVFKTLGSKVEKAKAAVKAESPERRAQIRKEKAGYDAGTFTPVDLRAGSYRGDGKESWDYNKSYPNGRKIGEHNMDYVIDVKEGSAKILRKGSNKVADIKGNYTVNEYDYSSNFYDPTMDEPVSSGKGSGKSNNFNLSGTDNYSGNSGFRAQFAKIDEVRNGVAEEVQHQSMNDAEIGKLNATRFKGKNFHTAEGNMGDMYAQEVNGKMVNMDSPEARLASMDSSNNFVKQSIIDDMAYRQGKQFKLGGDMNNQPQGSQQSNNGLVSFNEGGTHEQNPLGGIPQNTNEDGSINTVEEGETKHNNYVFSDTLKILPKEADELLLPEDIEGMTYAEASKYLNKILDENANDPIIRRTVDKQLDNLKLGNEKARISYEADEAGMNNYDQQLIDEQTSVEQPSDDSTQVMDPNIGVPDLSSTGQATQSVLQSAPTQQRNFRLDPEMMNPQDENEMLLSNESIGQPQFKLGGNLYNNGGSLWNGPTPEGEQYLNDPYYQPNNYNLEDNGLNTTSPVNQQNNGINEVTNIAGSLGQVGGAVSGVASGGLGMAKAFNLKDQIEAGEKINKGQVALKGAATGATIGGSVGSVIPVVGTAIGAAAGAVIGGVSGLIVGGKAAKKADKRRMELDENEFNSKIADFRTVSGLREGDNNEFENGGSLIDPPKNKFNLNNLSTDNYLQNINLLGFDTANMLAERNGVSNQDLDELVIEVPKSNISTQNQPVPTYNLESEDQYSKIVRSSASPQNNAEEDDKDRKLLLKGGSPLKYAPVLGMVDDYNRLKDTQFRESYQASGQRYEPQYMDENLLTGQVKSMGATTDRLLQANASGNAGAARAAILANQMGTHKSLSDVYQKILEYNSNQDQRANQVDNEILRNRDTIMNAQEVANMNNRQSEFELQRNARNRIYNTFGEIGKEQTMRNQSENFTGYDVNGNKIERKYYQPKKWFNLD